MSASNNKKSHSYSGMTLIEVMVATFLVILGLTTFLGAFSALSRAARTADNRSASMQRAREIMEAIMAESYDSPYLNIGTHTLPDSAYYTVSQANGYTDVKLISVTVPWSKALGTAPNTLTIHGAMAQCIH